ncbi:MAG: NAD(P)/FAD-dependent oxidoreductase [Pseudomonadota bacterium]
MARKTDVVVIGAGQAGLATSHALSALGIDHVVIERGAVGERWRNERWASLKLLSPNWMTRLPGWRYRGDDPEGFMHKDAVVRFLTRYGRGFGAPTLEYTRVRRVTAAGDDYRVETDRGAFLCRSVVLATGACDTPAVPAAARTLPAGIAQFTTRSYAHPGTLPQGGVLIVGASATGAQLAEEIHLSGRPVTLAVGAHVPLPRSYRGSDIMEWMSHAGILGERRSPGANNAAILRQPSLQLIGRTDRELSLQSLADLGVTLTGRLSGFDGPGAWFEPRLAAEIASAAQRRARMLSRIDAYIDVAHPMAPKAATPAPDHVPDDEIRSLDLAARGIRSVLWATGFRRDYSWLHLPILTREGELMHDFGATPAPGVFAMGLPFMRRRNSVTIDGVGQDAVEIAAEIAAYLNHTERKAA